jgi:nickel-dependent lactate racemase
MSLGDAPVPRRQAYRSPVARVGGPGATLAAGEVHTFIGEALAGADLDGRSVCLIIPDATRSGPLPLVLRSVHAALHGRVKRLTALVALGTHAEMTGGQLAAHLGYHAGDPAATYPGMTVQNHRWWDPDTFVRLGVVPAARLAELSAGRIAQDVPVRINRAVLEHDVALVVGPVFPHEVVGFSGGNKYFFPGVGGAEVINVSHWLGALLTSMAIIGTGEVTPVRALIDDAAALIGSRRLALCLVAGSGSDRLHALAFGEPEPSWRAAAEVSALVHIRHLAAPVRRVVSVIPRRYQEMWTAAKGFYKVEPVVADGGEVILYAPHVTGFAAAHPEIERVGYHCRDYFTGQWERFRRVPWAVLAHSTHLRGAGSYDERTGERCRVTVSVASAMPAARVRGVSLNHVDPGAVDLAALAGDPDTLVVPDAGEILFRLAAPPASVTAGAHRPAGRA